MSLPNVVGIIPALSSKALRNGRAGLTIFSMQRLSHRAAHPHA
jgi:hypothetical protein